MSFSQVGAFPLTGVGALPNVDVAYPGEVWTNRRATGVILPGSAVMPTASVAGEKRYKVIGAADEPDTRQVAIAMRQIMVPDVNPGSEYTAALGPNEIVNLPIASADYVRTYHTGGLHLTLVVPQSNYEPGDLIGWNPLGVRPAGKAAGTGAWDFANDSDVVAGTDIFEVENWRPYGDNDEGVLTVKFLRSNN